MKEELTLKNRLKEARSEKNLSQAQLAEMVGVSRNTISSIETGQFSPTAKLALVLCIALDKNLKNYSILNKIVLFSDAETCMTMWPLREVSLFHRGLPPDIQGDFSLS